MCFSYMCIIKSTIHPVAANFNGNDLFWKGLVHVSNSVIAYLCASPHTLPKILIVGCHLSQLHPQKLAWFLIARWCLTALEELMALSSSTVNYKQTSAHWGVRHRKLYSRKKWYRKIFASSRAHNLCPARFNALVDFTAE